jgi:acyl transferase domain-containing protein/acyl-CoA synthetase (AMP-forming)/AMP-acid ligase II/thioesterase domain-containing protein/acyl carrier protein
VADVTYIRRTCQEALSMAEQAVLRPVSDLLRHNADRFGEAPAFADDRRAVSWAGLARRTGVIAAGLNVARGERVAFLLDNSVELVEHVFAAVRAAAIGVLLSPHSTDAELAALLADCDPAVLVTDERHLAQLRRLPANRRPRLVMSDADDHGPITAVPDDLGLDEPAWLLYTSGTTGTPKGVLFTQRAALWSPISCYGPMLGLGADDRLLWPLPLAHSFAHSLCLLGVCVAGASARIVNAPDPTTVARLLAEYQPTVLAGVPTSYRQLLDVVSAPVPSLRVCVTAGAPSDANLRSDIETLLGAPLLDCYGSTETCGMIAAESTTGERVTGASGLPIPGVDVRLVDPVTGTPAEFGAAGELYVRGPGLMLGYRGRPEATAAALPDGWYRTGDLGRIDADGHVFVVGRVSEVIIRGGTNVDPAEVEQVLRGLAGVRDTAVVAREHPLLGEVPVAFVVPVDDGVDPAALLRECAALLSAHKVPEEILFIPAIPRTASGKPKRGVLRETLDVRPSSAAVTFTALSPGELRAAVADLVNAETAVICGGPSDPATAFADLGLTSMGAMTLWQRLSVLTGLRLPSTIVWDQPNPAALSADLVARLSGRPARRSPATRQTPTAEPIAIVAMGCRYPGGVRSPEDLWRLVAEGVDATSDFPTNRGWDLATSYDPDPERIGTTYVRRGGFLHDAAEFDPAFFGIAPREALAIDPQHRLLLEVAWETFERAGIPASALRGTDTGVFVGLMHSDYGTRFAAHELESHLGIGSAGSLASGRISYVLGLRGPTMTIDTACSSSLVALNLATKALRAGECALALAGGVTVMSTVRPFISFSSQRGLSPDGRCRSFAAGADGTAWAEGAGLVLLERLADARRNGHPVLAVLRGSSVNSDGASNGLTAPNGEAQRELIRLALADAGLRAEDVDVVEGHGTGTRLGDPIEAAAVLDTYGQDRAEERPLWLGSVKSNLGHTQAASGVAGVIKMVEALRHGELPRSLYAQAPSPHVDWSAGAVRLLADAQPWPAGDRPRRAAVSSFGIGGTNAHVIVEEPPPTAAMAATPTWTVAPWLVSGSDEPGLRAHAAALAASIANGSIVDIAFSLATTRTALSRRAAALGNDRDSLVAGLRDLADGNENAVVRRATARRDPKVAFLFSGQGAQRLGMGRDLAAAFPEFAASFAAVCEQFTPYLPRLLRDVIDEGDADLLDRTDYAQPALFAFEVALHTLLTAVGLRADHLVGHSVGEIAAAHVAGVFSLSDAVRLVAQRGRLMAALPAGGAMIAVAAAEADVSRHLAELSGRVAVGAVNGPESVVLSGDEAAVTALAARIGRRSTRLRVSHAFHSPLIDPMLAEFRAVAESITYHRPAVPVVSALTGRPEPELLATADYWVRHARETVRFADAIGWLGAAGVDALVEIGPDAVLSALAEECVGPDREVRIVPAVNRRAAEVKAVLDALATLHVHGVPVAWGPVYAASGARRLDLPTYPFQRQRYWLDSNASTAADSAHPILDAPRPDADRPEIRHHGVLSTTRQPWLADHVIGDRVVVPATVVAELALRAGAERGAARIAELTMHTPLIIADAADHDVQVVVESADTNGNHPLTVWARQAGSTRPWTRQATGTVAKGEQVPIDTTAWPPPDAQPILLDYDRLAASGFHYGPAFRAVTALWRRDAELFADLALPPSEAASAGRYAVHPALLDAALHAMLLAEPQGSPRVPFSLTGVDLSAPGAAAARARITPIGPDEVRVVLTTPAGQPLASVASLVTRPIELEPAGGLLRPNWVAATPTGGEAPYELFRVDPQPTLDPPAAARRLLTDTLARLRDWVSGEAPERLVVVTVRATTDDPDPASAAVWGLVRSAQAEHPDRIALVDLCGAPASESALPAAATMGQPQLAVREGVILAPVLEPVDTAQGRPPALDTGSVLITGSGGGLAGILARHLVTTYGVRRLVLASRRGARPAWAADLAAEVTSLACDVSDEAAVRNVVASCQPPLTAVFHLAGVLDDGVLDAMTPQRIDAVLAPKADGAWNLHRATEHHRLSAFVLYSSAVGVLGRAGQANYAAANAFLDALARHRVARSLPAQSLAWGPWADGASGGMTERMSAVSRRQLAEDGVRAIGAAEGMALLDRALRTDEPVLVPLLVEQSTEDSPARREPARSASVAASVSQEPGEWRRVLSALPVGERPAALAGLIRAELAAVLGFPDAESFPADKHFTDVGFDSLSAVQLRNRLSTFSGIRLSATIALDHPTFPELVAHVQAAMDGVLTEPAPQPEPPTPAGPDSVRFSVLYHRVMRERGAAEAMALRYMASYALPSFPMTDRAVHAVQPVRLAEGVGGAPALMFFPGYLPLFPPVPAALAAEFAGEHDLFLLDNPGFAADRPLPDSVATLAALHAESVRRLSTGEPVVLIGHCSGGAIAHAVASRLAAAGHPPAGVILIETHHGVSRRGDVRALALMSADRDRPVHQFAELIEDSVVIAGGGYVRIFDNWEPEPIAVPAVLLRAGPTRQMREIDPDRDWRPTWPLPHDVIDIVGDHMSVLGQDAATTAAAMRTWLSTLPIAHSDRRGGQENS